MVLIVDDSAKQRKFALREKLYLAGIPCMIVNSEQLKKKEPARITVAFAENETQLSIVSLRAGVTDYIVINDTGRKMINCDAYFYDPELDGAFADFIIRRAHDKHGIAIHNTLSYPARFTSKGAYFFNRAVNLTLTEEMIVRHLLFAKGEWHTAEEIANYSFNSQGRIDGSSISVHICNINNKSLNVTGKKIILAKRFYGYKINAPGPEKKKRGPYNIKTIPPRFV